MVPRFNAFFEQEARVIVSWDVERRSLRQAQAPAEAPSLGSAPSAAEAK
jgi:hypothetical protein